MRVLVRRNWRGGRRYRGGGLLPGRALTALGVRTRSEKRGQVLRSCKPDPAPLHLAEAAGLRSGRSSGSTFIVAQEPLIHREELTATLFAISHLNENVREILEILREEDDGEEPQTDA